MTVPSMEALRVSEERLEARRVGKGVVVYVPQLPELRALTLRS